MTKILMLTAALTLLCLNSHSQGCIAVRNIAGFGQYNFTDNAFSTSAWQLDLTGRYFKSFRDFRGTVDQKTPPQDEFVNHVYTLDVSVSKMLKRDGLQTLVYPLQQTTEHLH